MLSGPTLLYGPPGCGKTLFAKACCKEVRQPLVIFVASEILKEPYAQLEKTFTELERSYKRFILIEDVDELFVDLREDKAARRYLLGKFKDRSYTRLIFATTRRPESLLPDEISVFSDILPFFYPDEKGRVEILAIHVRKRNIILPSTEITDIAKKTEWWSGEELEQLITESHVARQQSLSVVALNQGLSSIGRQVIVKPREQRIRELLIFTKEHCTHKALIENIERRFGKLDESLKTPPYFNWLHLKPNIYGIGIDLKEVLGTLRGWWDARTRKRL